MFKTYLKCYGYLFSLIFILTLLLSIINYLFNTTTPIIKILIPIISIFISSIILGKNTKSKAYLEGIKFISIYLLLITILKFIFVPTLNYKIIIMYLVLIFSSIIGSMLGINLKKNN